MNNEDEKVKARDAFIRSARVARLATVSAAQQPHVVPICYVYDGNCFYSVLDQKPKRRPPEQLQRVRNLQANPRVSLLIDEYDDDWTRLRYVLAQGDAEIINAGEEHARALRLLREKYAPYQTMSLESSPIIKIKPTKFISWKMSGD